MGGGDGKKAIELNTVVSSSCGGRTVKAETGTKIACSSRQYFSQPLRGAGLITALDLNIILQMAE